MAWWHIPVYLVDLTAMVLLSFFLGDLVDTLDKKTKISGAFIGGVLLAAVTPLPELSPHSPPSSSSTSRNMSSETS